MSVPEPMHYSEMSVESRSAEETRALAGRLGELLCVGDFIALIGPLGAGKTCFAQGLGEALGVRGPVTSPTFVLMRLHRGQRPLCHADAYRVQDAAELLDAGIEDWLEDTVVALEWADTVPEALPPERIEVILEHTEWGRRVRLRGMGARAAAIIQRMRDHDDSGH